MEPKAQLEAPVRALWWTLGWIALTAFALVVALALWLGRIISRSVGQAARAAIALGEGGPLLLSGTPVAEVNTLMAELRETAAKRQAAEGLLRRPASANCGWSPTTPRSLSPIATGKPAISSSIGTMRSGLVSRPSKSS